MAGAAGSAISVHLPEKFGLAEGPWAEARLPTTRKAAAASRERRMENSEEGRLRRGRLAEICDRDLRPAMVPETTGGDEKFLSSGNPWEVECCARWESAFSPWCY